MGRRAKLRWGDWGRTASEPGGSALTGWKGLTSLVQGPLRAYA